MSHIHGVGAFNLGDGRYKQSEQREQMLVAMEYGIGI